MHVVRWNAWTAGGVWGCSSASGTWWREWVLDRREARLQLTRRSRLYMARGRLVGQTEGTIILRERILIGNAARCSEDLPMAARRP